RLQSLYLRRSRRAVAVRSQASELTAVGGRPFGPRPAGIEGDRRTAPGGPGPMLGANICGKEGFVGFLKAGAHPNIRNNQGYTALMIACAEALIDAGAERGLRNKKRQTAADIAAVSGHAAITELLK